MLFNICHPPEDRTDADVSTVQWCKYMLYAATGSSIGSIERQKLLLARYSSDQYCSYCAAKEWEKVFISVFSFQHYLWPRQWVMQPLESIPKGSYFTPQFFLWCLRLKIRIWKKMSKFKKVNNLTTITKIQNEGRKF